jgi:hypothetical protein
MKEFERYLHQIQEMRVSINFDELQENEFDSQDEIIMIIQKALSDRGYRSEVEETKTSWQKVNHLTKLKIFKRQ